MPRSPHDLTRATPRRPRGSAVLEAAIVFPLLCWLTFGSIECGYFFFVKHTFQGAAREGARAGIPPGATNADVIAAVTQTMHAGGFDNAPTIKYTVAIRNPADTANADVSTVPAATGVLVKVTATWGTVCIMPPWFLSSSKAVTGTTVMRKEG